MRSLIACLLLLTGQANAQQRLFADQGYIGIGVGTSLLAPDTESGVDADDEISAATTLFLGRDLGERTSAQMQLHWFGDVDFESDAGQFPNGSVTYAGVDMSVLYRFLNSGGMTSSGQNGVSVYGRFGLGYIDRDSDLELEDDEPIWFGIGAGIEVFLGRVLAVRAEGMYVDSDAGVAYLSLVRRFGGSGDSVATGIETGAAGSSIGDSTDAPIERPLGRSQDQSIDGDADGVPDQTDTCPQSVPGFPVQANGCALLDGVLTGVRFAIGSTELLAGSTGQLNSLVAVLKEYPDARIELHAHSDDAGSAREQAIITRGRLRTVGTYLVAQGINANRVGLRSFGGSRPLYRNDTPTGRADNNRIEILEKPF